MPVFIDPHRDRPGFLWDIGRLLRPLAEVRYCQGRLLGRMEGLPLPLREEACLGVLTLELVRSAELEGELLPSGQVRAALAGSLGWDCAAHAPAGIDAVAAAGMLLDVLQHHDQPLTDKRLTEWYVSITPVKEKRLHRLVHYQGPEAQSAPGLIRSFMNWFNTAADIDPVIKAGVASWWFMTLHPFDRSNGRIARAIVDILLARADNSSYRFYSLSDMLTKEKEAYNHWIAAARKTPGRETTPDITAFLEWFLHCLGSALSASEHLHSAVMRKARFWEKYASVAFNERQRLILERLLAGIEPRLTSSYWARMTVTSSDTAVRDINDLVQKGILAKAPAGGRSTRYVLVEL